MVEESSAECTRKVEEASRGVYPKGRGKLPDSHKPVENQRFTRSGRFENLEAPTGPNRPAEAADGPLRAGQGGKLACELGLFNRRDGRG